MEPHTAANMSLVFVELGLVIIGLALLARVASRFGFSAIPLYLIAGLAFGKGGIVPLRFGQDFVQIGAEVGVILLLFTLGLEYTGEKLIETLTTGYIAGAIDLFLNFLPGFAAGFLLGMGPLAAVLLGGVTYISSSGIIAKILRDLGRSQTPEAALVISILVLEDLAMAAYLPVVAVLLSGKTPESGIVAVGIALATVVAVLLIALHLSRRISRFVAHQSDEVVLLTALGLVLLVAGIAQQLQVSAAIGAFLVGVAISGPIASRAERLMTPLRDLFAATFFLFFGLEIDPRTLPAVMGAAVVLAFVTALSKIATGVVSGKIYRLSPKERLSAGATLTSRGEFSIVIAGLGAALDPRVGSLSAAYVLILAVCGPILARLFRVRSGNTAEVPA